MLTIIVLCSQRTLQCMLLFNLFLAPNPPLNVNATTINSTAVQVSWNLPNITNGIIRYYTVVYGRNDSSETQQLNSTDITTVVTALDPFRTYVFYVVAFTVELSNRSENDTALTSEAGNTYTPLYCTCILLLFTLLLFSSQCPIKCGST